MSNTFVIIGVIALLAILGVFGAATLIQNPSQAPTVEKEIKIPNLALKDYSGQIINLADFIGTPLVVNSWAAWCPFCKKELVDFATAQKELGGKVRLIAIDRAEPLEIAKKYSDELGVTNDLIFLLDPDDSFYQAIGGFSMPETIFVDSEGIIRFHKRGPMEIKEIRERAGSLVLEENKKDAQKNL